MPRDVSFFTEIKQNVPLDDYFTNHLNVDFVSDGPGRLAACCPFHDEDTPSFKIMDSDDGGWKRWYCYGACNEGGTIIDAVMKAENFSEANEAAEFLNELYNLGLEINSEGYKRFMRTVAETKQKIGVAQEKMSDPNSRVGQAAKAYLHNRGFSDETISHFGLAVDDETTKAGRLAIPLIDKANHAVSIANRALFDSHPCAKCGEVVTAREVSKRRFQARKAAEKGEDAIDWEACPHCGAAKGEAKIYFLAWQEPKYLFLRDFDKANFMYHEWHARRILRESDCEGLFMVEGYADVWAGYQSGHEAICSYNGAQMSDWQAKEVIEMIHNAERTSKEALSRPIILVPDFDSTGQYNVDVNIRKLLSHDEYVEIQVVHGIDHLFYDAHGERKACKDLGEVLQHFGPDKVSEILRNNRWPAAEWQIRKIINAVNTKTGKPMYSKAKEFELVAEVISHIRTKESLDHLIVDLSNHWNIPEPQARSFFYSHISSDESTSARHLFKDSKQAEEEAREFLLDGNVIPFGFNEIDRCFPGGGARKGQLAMMLGKSGTGKAQPLDAKVLTNSGWKPMGEIVPGDSVVDPTGGFTQVTGIFDQGMRPIYKVTLTDGSSTEVDVDHIWTVRKGDEILEMTTAEMLTNAETVDLPKLADFDIDSLLDDGNVCISGQSDSRVERLSQIVSSAHAEQSDGPLVLGGLSVHQRAEAIALVRSLGGNATAVADDGLVIDMHDIETNRTIASIEYVGEKEAKCLTLDSAARLYVTDDYIVTHNTMLSSQLIANMVDRDIRPIFFSLEQQAGSLFQRLTCQALDVTMQEAEELIKQEDPALAKVHELFEKMLIIDNVPTQNEKALDMTPGRVQSIIQEANLTHFEGAPADVVIIDHLGILRVPDHAPHDIKSSDTMAPGYIMQELFEVCKATNVFMIVLQQLPKEVPAGVPFSYDAGRGGSKQTDYCDYIFQIWRPEQEAGIDDQKRAELDGQYKLAFGKNRHGSSTIAHLHFDKSSLRIMPALHVEQPIDTLPLSDGEEELFGDLIPSSTDGTDFGATDGGMQELVRQSPDNLPRDTNKLSAAIGLALDDEEQAEDPFGDIPA